MATPILLADSDVVIPRAVYDALKADAEKPISRSMARRYAVVGDMTLVPNDELAQLRADAERGRRALKILIETATPATRSVLPAQYLLDQGLAYLKEIGFADSDGKLTTEANAFHRAATTITRVDAERKS